MGETFLWKEVIYSFKEISFEDINNLASFFTPTHVRQFALGGLI